MIKGYKFDFIYTMNDQSGNLTLTEKETLIVVDNNLINALTTALRILIQNAKIENIEINEFDI